MKGRRSHDKDTGQFAFTFLTITSFPATNGLIALLGIKLDDFEQLANFSDDIFFGN